MAYPGAHDKAVAGDVGVQPAPLRLPAVLDLSAVCVLHQGDVEQTTQDERVVWHPPHRYRHRMQQTVAVSCGNVNPCR